MSYIPLKSRFNVVKVPLQHSQSRVSMMSIHNFSFKTYISCTNTDHQALTAEKQHLILHLKLHPKQHLYTFVV